LIYVFHFDCNFNAVAVFAQYQDMDMMMVGIVVLAIPRSE